MRIIIFIVGRVTIFCTGNVMGHTRLDSTIVVMPDSIIPTPVATVTGKRKKRKQRLPIIYFQAFGGFGMALAFSDDIEEIFDKRMVFSER